MAVWCRECVYHTYHIYVEALNARHRASVSWVPRLAIGGPWGTPIHRGTAVGLDLLLWNHEIRS